MVKHNKFEYIITQNDDTWNAKIMRRVTARKMIISKHKKGFESESLANTWAKNTLDNFIKNLQSSNQEKTKKRQDRNTLLAKQQAEKALATIKYQEKQQASIDSMKRN